MVTEEYIGIHGDATHTFELVGRQSNTKETGRLLVCLNGPRWALSVVQRLNSHAFGGSSCITSPRSLNRCTKANAWAVGEGSSWLHAFGNSASHILMYTIYF